MTNNTVRIRIYNGKNKTYYFRKILNKEGFSFNKKAYGKGFWEKKIEREDEENINKLQDLCNNNKLKFQIIYPEYYRSNDYRKAFFEKNKGFLDGHYFCAYCGFIFKRDTITVDHIFPIDKVYKGKFYQKIMKLFKIDNVNAYKNLACACKRCNSKKGRKIGFLGLWVLKGFIGKHNTWWFFVWTSLLIICVYIIKIILFN